jgi:hypothetical protein
LRDAYLMVTVPFKLHLNNSESLWLPCVETGSISDLELTEGDNFHVINICLVLKFYTSLVATETQVVVVF